jgi:hypothetical protein
VAVVAGAGRVAALVRLGVPRRVVPVLVLVLVCLGGGALGTAGPSPTS